jgi:hypothetical protein
LGENISQRRNGYDADGVGTLFVSNRNVVHSAFDDSGQGPYWESYGSRRVGPINRAQEKFLPRAEEVLVVTVFNTDDRDSDQNLIELVVDEEICFVSWQCWFLEED